MQLPCRPSSKAIKGDRNEVVGTAVNERKLEASRSFSYIIPFQNVIIHMSQYWGGDAKAASHMKTIAKMRQFKEIVANFGIYQLNYSYRKIQKLRKMLRLTQFNYVIVNDMVVVPLDQPTL